MDAHVGGDDDGDDKRRVTVAVYLYAQACIRQSVKVRSIRDVYSTAYAVAPIMATLQCTGRIERTERRQTVRQTIEVGVVPSAVLSGSVRFDEVNVSREEGAAVLQTLAHVKLLFLDEGNVPLVAERQMECLCRTEAPEDQQCSATVSSAGDMTCSISGGGIEVRFTACFDLETSERRQLLALTDLRVDTEHPRDTASMPSVVLKLFDKDESLWEIAKRYSTTVEVVRAANDLGEGEDCRAGQMLLIPRKR
jgi:hypothetical protein